MKNKVLIIGIDGGTWDVLNLLFDNGVMPALSDLVKSSTVGVLKSTEPPITPAAWTSFYTGLPADVHGIRGFRILQKNSKGHFEYKLVNNENIGYKSIWSFLSDRGKKICLINLPLSYPPPAVNGIVVSGFPIPSQQVCYTYPKGLKKEILKKIQGFEILTIGRHSWSGNIERFVDKMVISSRTTALLGKYLLQKDSWDLFMLYFQETDLIQHPLWFCLDPTHESFTKERFNIVSKFYNALDEQINMLLQEARNIGNTRIIFLSDHGFQKCRYCINLNTWLYRNGYLQLRKNVQAELLRIFRKGLNRIPLIKRIKNARTLRSHFKDAFVSNVFFEKVLNYKKSLGFFETNGTNIAYFHTLGNIEANSLVFQKLRDLKGLDNKPAVKNISLLEQHNNYYIYKMELYPEVIAHEPDVSFNSLFTQRQPFKDYQVGVHSKDGIIVTNGFPSNLKDLPLHIHQFPSFINKIMEIEERFTPQKIGGDFLIKTQFKDVSFTQERKKIEDQLKNLGYL